MKITVIMIDGGFRENAYGADYFSKQDFSTDEYEILWVDYFDKVHDVPASISKVDCIALERSGEYHSSYCFNEGIRRAQGDVIVIPDADLIVEEDYLSQVWELHQEYEKLVAYGYRYDEIEAGELKSFEPDELRQKCVMKNPLNYGGCLTVRKKWLLEINGYEQHPVFGSGFHANGLDIYTRFKNLGLSIMWSHDLKLYHPWHPFTLANADAYNIQRKLIQWRSNNLQYLAFSGLDTAKNEKEQTFPELDSDAQPKKSFFKKLLGT